MLAYEKVSIRHNFFVIIPVWLLTKIVFLIWLAIPFQAGETSIQTHGSIYIHSIEEKRAVTDDYSLMILVV
jgi:Na+/H+ antiporter NhaC